MLSQSGTKLKAVLTTLLLLNGITHLPAQSGWSHYNTGPVNYGALGQESTATRPGARTYANTGIDINGNFLLFGGTISGGGPTDSLFRYNLSTNRWSWIKGNNITGSPGSYGTMGVASPNNDPGGRYQSSSWKDAQGKFWIFSGMTSISTNTMTLANDLWKFDGTNWTWIKGTKYPTSPVYGNLGQEASANTPAPEVLSNTWADSSGYLWLFSGSTPTDLMWRYNPATNNWAWMAGSRFSTPANHGTKGVPAASNTPGGRRSAGTWIDDDDNLWLYGGWDGTTTKAYSDLWKFDTTTKIWTWIDGSDQPNLPPVMGTQGIPDPGNTPGGVSNTVSWKDPAGNFWLHTNGTLWKYNFPQSGISWEQLPAY